MHTTIHVGTTAKLPLKVERAEAGHDMRRRYLLPVGVGNATSGLGTRFCMIKVVGWAWKAFVKNLKDLFIFVSK